MKRLITILFLFITAISFGQTTPIAKVTNIIGLKAYNGTAAYVWVSDSMNIYTPCDSTADEVKYFAGTWGRVWGPQSKGSASVAAAVDTTPLSSRINDLYANKVDKVPGKGLSTEDYSTAEKANVAASVTHAANTSNPHSVTKSQVGLGNVPNVDATDASNISSGTLNVTRLPTNIPQSSITNLTSDLAAKVPTSRTLTIGSNTLDLSANRTFGLVKSDVGLSNVENTALSTWAGSSNITTLGTITTGTVPAANISAGTLGVGNFVVTGDVTSNNLILSKSASVPTANSDSSAKVFNHLFAGRAMPGVAGIGAVYEFQPSLFTKKISWFVPTGNSSGVINIGINAIGTTGSQPVTTTFSGNLFQSARRLTYESAATSGAVAGIRHNSLQWARGNADNKAGIFFVAKGGVANASTIPDLRWFVGFNGTTAQMTNADPSSNTNIFGFGKDAADTNVQFIYNDGSGTASKIDLGSNFPANTNSTDWYQFTIYAPTNSSVVYYHLKRINTGDEIAGMVNSDLPSQTQGLEYEIFINNNATASAARFDVGNIYIESEN